MRLSTKSRLSLLTDADKYLAEELRETNQEVITSYGFFRLIQKMYIEGTVRRLRRSTVPNEKSYYKYFRRLARLDMIEPDPDYGLPLLRVRVVSSQPAEEVTCLADPLCHISHLSAMQRWGLTDRTPSLMTFTRPDRKTIRRRLTEMMENHPYPLPPERFRLRSVGHPSLVRRRAIQVVESRAPGAFVEMPGHPPLRLATIGQTFLDMLQRPELCGGMSHVLEVYDEYAKHWYDDIISAVNTCSKKIVKCRAGYILEERLGIHHDTIDAWKASAPQRGGGCKLDPSQKYAPVFSETWMLSLNV